MTGTNRMKDENPQNGKGTSIEYATDKKSIFKALLGSAALLLMVLFMTACSETVAPTSEDADMTLNLDALEAETEFGPLKQNGQPTPTSAR
jgi:hypothetical protein